mmetsp:Transcript_15243/g.40360  ORF Transcript_15243/g.40360 Transcript_15243/m.40360 type:complete len:524 (+) Transcript_15243:65-1636(+)
MMARAGPAALTLACAASLAGALALDTRPAASSLLDAAGGAQGAEGRWSGPLELWKRIRGHASEKAERARQLEERAEQVRLAQARQVEKMRREESQQEAAMDRQEQSLLDSFRAQPASQGDAGLEAQDAAQDAVQQADLDEAAAEARRAKKDFEDFEAEQAALEGKLEGARQDLQALEAQGQQAEPPRTAEDEKLLDEADLEARHAKEDWEAFQAKALQTEQAQSEAHSDKLVVTTGYWRLTNADADQGGLRNGPGSYVKRMHVVMGLNVPIVAYGDQFGIDSMVEARGDTQPPLVDTNVVTIDQLPPCNNHEKMLRANITKYTNNLHMPSVSLGCVWDSKFSLVGRTAREHPEYGWYAWLDIGMHGGAERTKLFTDWANKPWPNQERLKQLPRDKISASRTFMCHTCAEGQYMPFCHCLAATAFVIPAEIVHEVVDFFYDTLEKCLKDTADLDDGFPCMSEQVIMTQMELRRPGLYNIIGKGYGDVAGKMISEFADLGGGDSWLVDWLSGDDAAPKIMLNQVD